MPGFMPTESPPATIATAPFGYRYTRSDYGTERTLQVYSHGQLIGTCDPFPNGEPVDARKRQQGIERAARRIQAKHMAA